MASRRLAILLAVLAVAGTPAAVLAQRCAGGACVDATVADIPFCSLPSDLRELIAAGYADGRSADVLVVSTTPILGGADADGWGWPLLDADEVTVPIAFWGQGLRPFSRVPADTRLAEIAPTIAELIRLRRPFPEVRTTGAIERLIGGPGAPSVEPPRLVVTIALRGVDAADLGDAASWPEVLALMEDGAGTLEGRVGSLPLDPAAALATIGTGGAPTEHGITSAVIRDDEGAVIEAWSDGAPTSIVSSLADDLLRLSPDSIVGVITTRVSDRGLVGRDWYATGDRVVERRASGDDAVADARRLLAGMGDDGAVDLLGVVLEGSPADVDARVGAIVDDAIAASGGSVLVVIAGTGGPTEEPSVFSADDVAAIVEDAVAGDEPVVLATVPGGIYLDAEALGAAGANAATVIAALDAARRPDGIRLVEDAFQGFAVAFGRYC